LRSWKIDRTPVSPQQTDGRNADIGEKLIGEAGDEQGNLQINLSLYTLSLFNKFEKSLLKIVVDSLSSCNYVRKSIRPYVFSESVVYANLHVSTT